MPPALQPFSPSALSRRTGLLALALVAAVLLVYFPAASLPFITLDDPDYVSGNPHVRAGLTWAGVQWAFTTTHACNWHPLTWLSHMADSTLFGPGPRGPHAANILLHAASSALLLLLLRRLTGSLWRSACVAALFALHPLRVESVAWVSERKDVLSAIFFLATLYSYANYTVTARRTTWYFITLAGFTLGLLSKPMLVTLPCVLLLLDVWPLQRAAFTQPRLREKIPFFILSIASCIATFIAQQQGGAVRTLAGLSFGQRLENAIAAIGQYLRLTFFPGDLAIYYPHPGSWPIGTLLLSLTALATLTFFAIRQSRRRPFITMGWFWFCGMLIPVIGLVQVGAQAMADRYTYLPSIGLFIALVWTITDLLPKRRTALALVFVGSIVTFATLTRAQLQHWRTSESLFRHTLAVTGPNFVAHYNLGASLLRHGRHTEAAAEFQKTLALHPRYAEAHVDLGNALLHQNQSQEAIIHYQQAIAINPHTPNARYNLGTALLQLGRLDEAIDSLQKASAEQPDSALPHLNLGTAFFQQNQSARAIAAFEKAVALDPRLVDAHSNLGLLLHQADRTTEAIHHLQIALRIEPDHANANFHLGNILLQQNQPAEAIPHLQKTLTALPDDLDTHSCLAYAFLQSGRPADAAVILERALALPEVATNPALRETLQQQLAACRNPSR